MKSENAHSKILDELLAAVRHCASVTGIELWLECGTLLGVIRDNDYIPWEDDLDFGTWRENIECDQRTRFGKLLQERQYTFEINDSRRIEEI